MCGGIAALTSTLSVDPANTGSEVTWDQATKIVTVNTNEINPVTSGLGTVLKTITITATNLAGASANVSLVLDVRRCDIQQTLALPTDTVYLVNQQLT